LTVFNMEKFINIILKLAKISKKYDEVPVGAIIVKDGKIISGAFNSIEKDGSSLAHAEIKAIQIAQKKLGNWRLIDCELYVTLEPCVMCSGAIWLSRIKKIYYLVSSEGYSLNNLNIPIEREEIFNLEAKEMLQNFFKEAREKKKIEKQIKNSLNSILLK